MFFGMLGVTAFGLLFTPVFDVVIRRLAEALRAWNGRLSSGSAPVSTSMN